jgi:putative aminopeptidase FrvX
VPIPDILRTLVTTAGPSGAEEAAAEAWREAASAFAEVSGDAMGNSVARVRGAAERPRVVLFGHIDEIGVTITSFAEEGYLRFRGLGGWDPQVLLAQRVEILTRGGPVPGVIGVRRDWAGREDKKHAQVKDLHIDIGARDADEARSVVRVGDTAVLASEPLELRNGRVASRAFDNRLGAYVILEVARRVAAAGGPPGELAAVATVEEEVGDFLGARTSAFALEPDVAIVVDVTFATDVPGAEAAEAGEIKLGGGPSLTRGPGLASWLFERLADTAAAAGISYAIEVSKGSSGTDQQGVYVSRAGVPSAVVSVPIRYFHTPTEVVDLADLEATIKLLVAAVQGLDTLPA